ncbi:SGNH hydrolase [Rickenella mellea]|uniref:SGNH hydrolase n=1 Tax=Rickenella mellea TaxID=50990 RepID=A0A4Y7QD81_9AGAM|nr:SGNH hydrolase [Rickenella mellea]
MQLLLTTLLFLVSSAIATPGSPVLAAAPAATTPVSFVLVGDSTTNNDTVVDSGGWGNGFCASLAKNTPCINTAHDGATTGSFIAQGLFNKSLAAIKGEVAKGRRTLVTIQFGHNDMKIAPPASMGANLTIMVNAIRAIKGEPVLVTSLSRRNFFPNGTINDALGPWADETILISQQEKTHLLDLHKASITYLQKIGQAAANRLSRTLNDTTHLNANGTIVFGRIVANLMNASYPNQLPIIANPTLTNQINKGIPSF